MRYAPTSATAAPHSTCRGACNEETVKDVALVGARQEVVAAGSDGGLLLLWERATGEGRARRRPSHASRRLI